MAKAPLVTVYAPDGKAFKYSRANARDLVVGAGWSFQPNAKSTPLDPVPGAKLKAEGPEPAQRVLNSAGHNTERQFADVIPDETPADEGEQVDPVAEAIANADPVEGEEAAPEAAAAEEVAEVEGAETAGEEAAPTRRSGGRKARS